MFEFFKILGGLGLLFISIGVVTKKRRTQDMYYILGGLCLEAYSVSIGDMIFMTLQLIFIAAALYDLFMVQPGR